MENNNALTIDREIPDEHLTSVCLYRQGPICCKYIVFFEQKGKFYCVKNIPELREKIDLQTEMYAQGDNCEGLPHEKG